MRARLEALLDALETCEWFYCGDPDDEIGSFVELIQVITILGNNPYNAADPTREDASDPSSSGVSSIAGGIQVLPLSGGGFIPIDQFVGPASPDACDDPHYHDTGAIVLPILDCDGGSQTDPAPGVCGYGTVDDVITIAPSQCSVRD